MRATARPSKIVPRRGEPLAPVVAPRPAAHQVRTSKLAQAHKDWLAGQGCLLCELLGQAPDGKTDVHHVREGQGLAERASDYLGIPLCHAGCHQGPQGLHGDRSRFRLAKVSEMDLLAIVIARMASQLHQGKA